MTSIIDLLHTFRQHSTDQRGKGDAFERLMAQYLVTDAVRKQQFKEAWLWSEWPELARHPDLNRQDTGVDLVALQHDGTWCAVQCKMYDEDARISMDDLKGFMTLSGKSCFSARLIIATVRTWTANLEKGLAQQTIPVEKINLDDLEASDIDWSRWSPDQKTLPKHAQKTLRPYQQRAYDDVLEGFRHHDRGKLIMACGTGKTLTGLRIVEGQVPIGGIVLFAVPSLTLLAQTLREWANQAHVPLRFYAVCSDSGIGKDHEDMRVHDLAYPSTTDPERLVRQAVVPFSQGITVILSTYQSLEVVHQAQALGLPAFDLVLCDEAHRTTGVDLPAETKALLAAKKKRASPPGFSAFLMVHEERYIQARKRLYMTATPRVYTEKTKKRLEKHKGGIYSMDDERVYGPEFHRLGFDEAVRQGILVDFQVLVVVMDEDAINRVANLVVQTEKGVAIKSEYVAQILGAWKALSKTDIHREDGAEAFPANDRDPLRSAVAFAQSIKKSQELEKAFSQVVDQYLAYQGRTANTTVAVQHVDGTMSANSRYAALKTLHAAGQQTGHCQILTNAKCLSEGVDVPSLDAVLFFDARDSMVDVVQAVGRVMRQSPRTGKKQGYIILPIGISAQALQGKEPGAIEKFVTENSAFQGVWKVLRALRSHDERLVDDSEYRKRVTVLSGGSGGGDGGGQIDIVFPEIPMAEISRSVYAVIPDKLGDREYWADWSREVADVARNMTARLGDLLLNHPGASEAFSGFLRELQSTINPAVTADDAQDMLVQHLITRPVFAALFPDQAFVDRNPVSQAMQRTIGVLDEHVLTQEAEGLHEFYASVERRVQNAKSDQSKQDVVRNLYDTFFQAAYEKLASRLGIVYTPVEVVDFILHSTEITLQEHFGAHLTDKGVQILDPFTGTGTFIVRLLQSGLIRPENLPYKYAHEMHANEMVLLAYYIAAINIESAYHAQTHQYEPFEGIVLTDTFQMDEDRRRVDQRWSRQDGLVGGFSKENSERVNRQKRQDIRVIIGNPPYSAQQESENDNNKNLAYPTLDSRIRETYAAQSNAKLAKNLYDSYIRALRWASDRIQSDGVIAFVTNGSFLEKNSADGLRLSLAQEFSHLYILNLRGFIRGKSGDEAKREGQGIFDIMTGVAITILVKDSNHKGPCEIRYHDIGDYLNKARKLESLRTFNSIANVPWQLIEPNSEGDWLNPRDPLFDTFMPLGSKDDKSARVVFSVYSLGVVTNRDAWAYNFSRSRLEANMSSMIETYNRETARYAQACEGLSKDMRPEVEAIIDADPKRISWTHNLKADAKGGKKYDLDPASLTASMYRPFTKEWLYFNRRFNERVYQMPRLFPTPEHGNVVLVISGIGSRKPFSALATKTLPDLELIEKGQCFPLHWYEKAEDAQDPDPRADMFSDEVTPDTHGYIRHEAITDAALAAFQDHYGDKTIGKEDLFWYVYGILHSPEYKERFASDLKKMLPRIPYAGGFWAFSRAGRALGEWHLHYETVEPYPLTEDASRPLTDGDYRVTKMAFGKKDGKPDKGVIVYNAHLTLRDIPLEAYDYVVNGKSAIEWIMERYAVTVDKDSGIRNDANDWSEDPRYIVDLVKRVVRVSVETVGIVNDLPLLGHDTPSPIKAERT
ncbi:MAG: DEAD/DEAH box helicase family protein [Gammaproteobacteria bacterium]|nr:DEAD/DEAH box helicase family protein [Gammaproteobacteria bacterium]